MYIQSQEGVTNNGTGVVNEPREKPPKGQDGFLEKTTIRSVSNAILVL